MHFKKLIARTCYLSPVSRDSAESWARWDNDLEVGIPLGSEPYTPTTLESSQENIESIIREKIHGFDILEMENNLLIGRCFLGSVDPVNRSARLGIVIGEKTHWDRGFGTESIQLLLDYAFNILNLNSVNLGTYSFNERAIACYKKVGFREIGRRREARIIGNQKFDAIMMDILATEYETVFLKELLPTEHFSTD